MGVVIRQSILTSIISYSGVIIGYVNLLYLYPKFLALEQVGLLRAVQDFAMLLSPFAAFGLGQSIIKFFPNFSSDKKKAAAFLTLIFILSSITFSVFLLIFTVFKTNIMSLFNKNAAALIEYTDLVLWLTFLLLLLTLLEQYSRSLLRVAFPALVREIVIRVLQGLLVSVYFLNYISFHQFMIASILIYVVAVLILAAFLIKAKQLHFNANFSLIPKHFVKQIVNFSALSFIGMSAMILIGKLDSLMVAGMINLDANAIYTTAFYMATVIEIPKRAITTTASPLIAQAFQREDLHEVNKLYKKTSINQFIIGALLLIGIGANLENIFEVMPKGELFKAGSWVVLIIGAGKLIDMVFGPSSEIIGLSKHYWFNLVVITLLAGMGVVANLLLIPKLGIEGAAYGSIIALVVYNLTKYIFIYFKFRIHPFTSNTLKVLVISVVVSFLNVMLPKVSSVFLDIFIRSSIITLCFGGLIVITKSSDEVNKIFYKALGCLKSKRH